MKGLDSRLLLASTISRGDLRWFSLHTMRMVNDRVGEMVIIHKSYRFTMQYQRDSGLSGYHAYILYYLVDKETDTVRIRKSASFSRHCMQSKVRSRSIRQVDEKMVE